MGPLVDPAQMRRIPILKLPPSWFVPAVSALLPADGSRADANRRVLGAFPGRDEKLAMRALVVPTLTRLHYIRAADSRLWMAPNGTMWGLLQRPARNSFAGVCLRDLLIIRAELPAEFGQADQLRAVGRALGEPYLDRVSGYARLMRAFPIEPGPPGRPFPVLEISDNVFVWMTLTEVCRLVQPYLNTALRGRVIVRLDDVRHRALRAMFNADRCVSSFVLDRALLRFMGDSRICLPAGSATNRLDGLVLGRRPFDAVRSMVDQ